MIITFKTLEQKTFKIEIDESCCVKALKEKIAEQQGSEQFPVIGQKLIYSGKILDDDKTVSDCKIDEKNFVVVMVVKQKQKPGDKNKDESSSSSTPAQPAAAAATAATTTPSAMDTTSSTPSAENLSSESASSITSDLSSATPSTDNASSQISTDIAESTLLTGSALESSITELMSFGYTRDQVMLALNRSFHNADRAAEYLLSGNIPDMPDSDMETGSDGGGGADALAASAAGDLSFLRNSSQFQRLRAQVQTNPDSLPVLLQQIGETNRDLLTLINQNQEQFIALLNEQGGEGDAGAEGGAIGGGAGGGGGIQIQVTANEKEAIDRIVSMGFPEPEVIQAFFACDKNEQLAIDFLLSN